MMRFDLTCNIALRVQPGKGLHVQVLPAITEQQQLLHEVIWVARGDLGRGMRALDRVGRSRWRTQAGLGRV